MQNLLSELDVGLGDDSRIDNDSQNFGSLYYRDIIRWIQFLLAHLSFQAQLEFEPVRLLDSEGCQIYSKMNVGDWWWDEQDYLPIKATILPVLCVSVKTY